MKSAELRRLVACVFRYGFPGGMYMAAFSRKSNLTTYSSVFQSAWLWGGFLLFCVSFGGILFLCGVIGGYVPGGFRTEKGLYLFYLDSIPFRWSGIRAFISLPGKPEGGDPSSLNSKNMDSGRWVDFIRGGLWGILSPLKSR